MDNIIIEVCGVEIYKILGIFFTISFMIIGTLLIIWLLIHMIIDIKKEIEENWN